ncbi:hypothetical protein MNBD_GAMMA01-1829 [hydrothermal vent metagenome]|uniref:Acyl-CoA dehydrogenase C-terminal bacterial-type domain-containing protein n=1 Tax=hydrothermal vent metagenome TaxID=652676 RepID=A0A3B0V2C7_9ZZZZ
MSWLLTTLVIITFIAGFYRLKLIFYSIAILVVMVAFLYFEIILNMEFLIVFIPVFILFSILNIKKLRRQLVTKSLYGFLKNSNNHWKTFQRIDDGWFASDFERSIFQGKPDFLSFKKPHKHKADNSTVEQNIHNILLDAKNTSHITKINNLAKIGATSLLLGNSYNGQNLSASGLSDLLKNTSKINPILASIIGLLNLDSLTSFIHHFASSKQKKIFLPLISKVKMTPFLKPTSLYETLESQKSSIEGRIEQDFSNGKQQLGVRISFQDIILLGTSKSNCFYINVNVKDFNNLHSSKTHLGTAICIINDDIEGLVYHKGLKAYDDYLYYYACTGENVFIPFSNIVNEADGIGKGLEYLYKNQCFASSIWPLSISIPTNNIATLTSWYFAHLQKQNGRQLLSYKVVSAKLNEQFSQCLRLQLLENLSLQNDLHPQLLKFIAILNKNTHIAQTTEQLGWLRGILGSNAHNIKTESKVRSFYKVAHLATELDGMSHEINQLPLIKKAAIACHPYYDQEIKLLATEESFDLPVFDKIIFQHIGYITQNLTKTLIYTLRTSLLGRILFPKNKYKYMIKRMSSSFAFLSDITLINWTFKKEINTSFASHLGECIQHLTTSLAVHDYYLSINNNQSDSTKELAKVTLKNSLYSSQRALKDTINLAFNRFSAILLKLLLFPFGQPFHQIIAFKPLHDDIEKICELDENSNSPYTKYSPFLKKIYQTKQKLKAAESAEIAVTNATGTPLTTDNYKTLINRCLAAGIVSVEQSEQLRDAYLSILEITLINHFGNNYKKNK